MLSPFSRIVMRLAPRPCWMAGAVLVGGLAWSASASAQNISAFFPTGSAGYDQEIGVTVLTRVRPLYEAPGINVGGFVIRSNVDQSIAYNSNVNGVAGSGSWVNTTSGDINADSRWVRDRLSASTGFSHNEFFSLSGESYTDWHVGIAGGYTIGNSLLNVAYSHQTNYSLGSTLGAIRTETPALNQTDTAMLNYSFKFADLTIAPSLSASAYRFGNSTSDGRQVTEAFLDRNVVAGGVDARYNLSEEGAVVAVARAVNSTFIHPQDGQPSNNSNSFQLLGGLDYQAKGPWRYRLLVGVETRMFQSSQFATRTAPIIEGSVIWTPTGLTTVTGVISREIEDPQSAGTSGYIATQGSLRVDHEFLSNVIVSLHGGAASLQYLQGSGSEQMQFTVGAGGNWSLNRNVRLGLGYNYTEQIGSSNAVTPLNPASVTTAPFRQGVVALSLHISL